MTAARYRMELRALFDRWAQRRGSVPTPAGSSLVIDHTAGFIRDGVVCPETWFSQPVRPLFLLKEAYGAGYWDLIADQLARTEQIRGQMWRRVSAWTYGLLATTAQDIAPYHSWQPIERYGNEYLRQAAVVNIRKSGGSSSSDMDVIRAYAAFDRACLMEELALCDPTILVCGYTASALDTLFDRPVRHDRNENLFYHVPLNGHDVLVLDYWHPANQYPDIMNYYGLMGIYQQALRST